MTRVAIDAMGGDFGPEPVIEGVIQALDERDFFLFWLVIESRYFSIFPNYYFRAWLRIGWRGFPGLVILLIGGWIKLANFQGAS